MRNAPHIDRHVQERRRMERRANVEWAMAEYRDCRRREDRRKAQHRALTNAKVDLWLVRFNSARGEIS